MSLTFQVVGSFSNRSLNLFFSGLKFDLYQHMEFPEYSVTDKTIETDTKFVVAHNYSQLIVWLILFT